jgi:hypothetical protein
MNKLFSVLLILVLLAGGSSVSAQEPHTSPLNRLAEGGTLEPLTYLDYKNPWNMVSDGRYVYIDSLIDPGYEVMVIDCIDPAHPVQIATMPMETSFRLLAVVGDALYIGQDWGFIFIYDVSDPANPLLSGTFGPLYTWAQQMLVVGDLAYLVDYYLGLAVLDISDPFHPQMLGNNAEEIIWSIALQGSYAYAIAIGKYLIYDVSNPAQPALVGRYEDAERWGEHVAVYGDFAYLSGSIRDDQYQTIGYFTDIFDVTDPSHPERLGDLPQLAAPVKQLNVENGLLYALQQDGLAIYSLADPLDPQLSGAFPDEWGMSVVWQGNQALLLDNVLGLMVLDTADLAQIVQIGFYGWAQEADYLTAAGSNLLTVKNYSGWYPDYHDSAVLRVIEMADPFAPHVSAYLVLDDKALGKPYVYGSYIYFAGNRGVTIIDASDPASLQVLGRTGNTFTTGVEVLDGKAYAITQDIGGSGGYLTVSDVSNPASPTLLSQTLYLEPKDVSITSQGGHAYAYLITQGNLVVLDVTDGANPVEVYQDSQDFGFSMLDTESRGIQTIAYLSGSMSDWSGLGVIALDVSDPANPLYLGVYLLSNIYDALVLEAADDLVYFSIYNELVLVDFSVPASPMQVLRAGDPDGLGIFDASVGEEYFYTTTMYNSILVFAKSGDLDGRVTDHNYKPVEGVSVALSNGEVMTTSADGSYAFPDLGFGDYVITPTLEAFVFTPAIREVSIPTDWISQTFVILPAPVSTVLEPGVETTLTYTDVQGLPTSFIFPAGLISTTAVAYVTPTLASGFFGADFAGHAFELFVDPGFSNNPQEYFTVPVSVTIQYSLEDAAGITDTTRLALYRLDGSGWTEADASCLPASSPIVQEPGVFKGAICQQGLFALLGPSHSLALPFLSFGGASPTCEPPNCVPLPLESGQE